MNISKVCSKIHVLIADMGFNTLKRDLTVAWHPKERINQVYDASRLIAYQVFG